MQQSDFNIILIYKFYFKGIATPLPIEAWNKDHALQQLKAWTSLMNINEPVVKQTVTRPLFGVTEKKIKGVISVWCGKEHSITGWMEQHHFLTRFGEI